MKNFILIFIPAIIGLMVTLCSFSSSNSTQVEYQSSQEVTNNRLRYTGKYTAPGSTSQIFRDAEASYLYIQNENGERIYDGDFSMWYYQDGKKYEIKGQYKNNLKHGHWRYDVGRWRLIVEANYNNGYRDGSYIIKDSKGNIRAELNFKNGKLTGEQKIYGEKIFFTAINNGQNDYRFKAKKVIMTTNMNQDGLPDGNVTVELESPAYEMNVKFRSGVLEGRLINVQNGEVSRLIWFNYGGLFSSIVSDGLLLEELMPKGQKTELMIDYYHDMTRGKDLVSKTFNKSVYEHLIK